jgi:ATP-dependent Clp protease ATP-binding subunit ClpA
MALAHAEAARRGHHRVGTEHVLLALVEEGRGVAAAMLCNRVGDLSKVRAEVERLLEMASQPHIAIETPQTSGIQRAMNHAASVASEMATDYIGTEHLLLGLLRFPESVAGRALLDLGLTYREARNAVTQILNTGVDPAEGFPSDPRIDALAAQLRGHDSGHRSVNAWEAFEVRASVTGGGGAMVVYTYQVRIPVSEEGLAAVDQKLGAKHLRFVADVLQTVAAKLREAAGS